MCLFGDRWNVRSVRTALGDQLTGRWQLNGRAGSWYPAGDQRRPIPKGFVWLSPFDSTGQVAQCSRAEPRVWYDRCLLIAAESFNVLIDSLDS